MKETDKVKETTVPETKEILPQLDYDALWKEAKYTGEHKESER